ncbi:MAG: hypothetical protein ACYCTF_03025 [Acidiferrobacter sp.]
MGTHTGAHQLPSRLNQHFVQENKDRSIFRKNIGRAFLQKADDPFLKWWDIDLTTRAKKQEYAGSIDTVKQHSIEALVTQYIQKRITFIVLPVAQKQDRLALESQIIATVSLCRECSPSHHWLGRHSPKTKIRESGLWIVNGLHKERMVPEGWAHLESLIQEATSQAR